MADPPTTRTAQHPMSRIVPESPMGLQALPAYCEELAQVCRVCPEAIDSSSDEGMLRSVELWVGREHLLGRGAREFDGRDITQLGHA